MARKQGETEGNQAWFGFTVEQLYWSLAYIPRGDGLRRDIKMAIAEMENAQRTGTASDLS